MKPIHMFTYFALKDHVDENIFDVKISLKIVTKPKLMFLANYQNRIEG